MNKRDFTRYQYVCSFYFSSSLMLWSAVSTLTQKFTGIHQNWWNNTFWFVWEARKKYSKAKYISVLDSSKQTPCALITALQTLHFSQTASWSHHLKEFTQTELIGWFSSSLCSSSSQTNMFVVQEKDLLLRLWQFDCVFGSFANRGARQNSFLTFKMLKVWQVILFVLVFVC